VNSQQQIRAQQGAVEPKGIRIDIRDLVNDIFIFGGAALAGYGAWSHAGPAGLIIPGLMLYLLGLVVLAKR
jgi:hypothetical protein